jgi:formamidopyrimidine-DNA glycosylase
MQALAERLDAAFAGTTLEGYDLLGFTGLKTAEPSPDLLVGRRVLAIGRRGKFAVVHFEGDLTVLIHLSQAGRIDVESPPKSTKPRGSVVRLRFDNHSAILVREHGTQRKAGWWVLGPGDEGPLAGLGPEPADEAFARFIMNDDSNRQLHTLLRDQHTVAGVGRGYADDALHRAQLSPFASLRSLDQAARERLVDAVRDVLAEGLEAERRRQGGLSEAKLGTNFTIHNHAGQPCPRCGEGLLRVSFDSHEIVYCKHCQTKGRALADRRLSRLLR